MVRKRAQKIGMTLIATMYEAAIDNTTASARALNRYLATPNRNMTGKNTMQVVMVEASTGSATSSAPSRAACIGSLPCSRWRLMFSSTTTESSTRRPIARAKPPRVMMLIVEPFRYRPNAPARIDSGIERKIANVERKLPRNIRIISEASTEPDTASWARLVTAWRM